MSASTTTDQNGSKIKLEAKTSTDPFKIGGIIEMSTDKNNNFKDGKAGFLIEKKDEAPNGSTIKKTLTVGKTY